MIADSPVNPVTLAHKKGFAFSAVFRPLLVHDRVNKFLKPGEGAASIITVRALVAVLPRCRWRRSRWCSSLPT